MTEVAFDPNTNAVQQLLWANVQGKGEEKTVIRATATFTRFELDTDLPPSLFEFAPPANSRRVEELPIPGQTGSFLLNKPAPDFELKTLDGRRVRLSSLRGQPVVLSFWASWCGPCRRELPELSDVYEKLGQKGLQVFGVNDEGSAAAKEFVNKMGIAFPTFDDSGRKAHALYRVRSIPTLFFIDAEGQVVRYLVGGRDKKELQKSLQILGY